MSDKPILCPCCALNSADRAGICCRKNPFGDGDGVTECDDYLTDLEQEDMLVHYYKHWDTYKKIRKLDHQIWLLKREITLKDREDGKKLVAI